jgi:hypothetical protein
MPAETGSENAAFWGFGSDVVQSGGNSRVTDAIVLTGVVGPLLCRPESTLTLKGTPAVAVGGLNTVAPTNLMSASAFTAVVRGALVLELFPGVGSVTCTWLVAIEAVAVKEWFEGFAQVTVQVTPVLADVDVGSDAAIT